MTRGLFFLIVALACVWFDPVHAQSPPRRVALVIANETYAIAGSLKNPKRDADIVAKALGKAGFRTVVAESDLNNVSFRKAVRDFRSLADGAEVALVYYAGHGIEAKGRNWLIPTDARLASERDLPYEAVDLDLVLASLDGASMRVVILDACRNNPLGRNWTTGVRSVSRGLEGLEVDDVLVIYAAAAGQTAADGVGANSPFATALARRLPEAGLPIQLLGGAVRDDVLAATGGVQRPFVSASVTGTPFYLVPGKVVAITPAIDAIDADGIVTVGRMASTQQIAPDKRRRGMADTPSLIEKAGAACALVDARLIVDEAPSGRSFYEIACNPGLGGVLMSEGGGTKSTFYSCLATAKPGADGKQGGLACALPANADAVYALAPFVLKTPTSCPIARARWIGSSVSQSYFEIRCVDGAGYILGTSSPPRLDRPITIHPCSAYEAGGNIGCKIAGGNDKETVDRLLQLSGKTCDFRDLRYMVTATNGSRYYEVACTEGTGYVLEQAGNGAFAKAIDCIDAPVGAECALTDPKAGRARQTERYSKAATAAGFTCQVERYARFAIPNRDVVELKCLDRPDGGIAVFGRPDGDVVYNCTVSEAHGYRCSLTPKSASFASVTRDLKAFGKDGCTVSDIRAMDRRTADVGYIEVACSDGFPGWVIGYDAKGKAKDALSCPQSQTLGGCKLPSNLSRKS